MNRNLILSSVLLLACCLNEANLADEVVYEQAPDSPNPDYIWTSHYGTQGETSGWRGWETFELNEQATVNQLEWWHASATFESGIGVSADVVEDRWVAEIRDAATNGGDFFRSFDLDYQSIDLGDRDWGSGSVRAFSNSAVVDDFVLEADTEYFISFLSYAELNDPSNSWWGSQDGDGVSFQQSYSDSGGFGDLLTRNADRAFRLSAVPEPSGVLLLLAGGLSMITRRRRA